MDNFEKFIGAILDHHPPKGLRILKSGMLGIVRGQTVRIHLLNSSTSGKATKSAWVQVIKDNKSEPLSQAILTVEPGASTYLDLKGDKIGNSKEDRLQIRTVVMVPDDEVGSCLATLEVFDDKTKRTSVLIPLNDINPILRPGYDNLEFNIEDMYNKFIREVKGNKEEKQNEIERLTRKIEEIEEQLKNLIRAGEKIERVAKKTVELIEKLREYLSSDHSARDSLCVDNGKATFEYFISQAGRLLKGDISKDTKTMKDFLDQLKEEKKSLQEKLKRKSRRITLKNLEEMLASMAKGGRGSRALALYIITAIIESQGEKRKKKKPKKDDDN